MPKLVLGCGGFLLLALIAGVLAGDSNKAPDPSALGESVSFSTTQTWSDANLVQRDLPLTILDADDYTLIALPAPPANASRETVMELAQLHSMSERRSPSITSQIIQELDFGGTPFGDVSVDRMREQAIFPRSLALLEAPYQEISIIALRQKALYDRVRPSLLDPTLSTVIAVPAHPAYPSAHAAQARLLAYILSDLDPTQEDRFFAAADRIAVNREIAGVHYPSDSKAGKLLADQYYELLKETTWYQETLQQAIGEW